MPSSKSSCAMTSRNCAQPKTPISKSHWLLFVLSILTLSFFSSILSSSQFSSQHDRLFALLLPYITRLDPQLHRNLRLLPKLNQYLARSSSLILCYCAQTLTPSCQSNRALQIAGYRTRRRPRSRPENLDWHQPGANP